MITASEAKAAHASRPTDPKPDLPLIDDYYGARPYEKRTDRPWPRPLGELDDVLELHGGENTSLIVGDFEACAVDALLAGDEFGNHFPRRLFRLATSDFDRCELKAVIVRLVAIV